MENEIIALFDRLNEINSRQQKSIENASHQIFVDKTLLFISITIIFSELAKFERTPQEARSKFELYRSRLKSGVEIVGRDWEEEQDDGFKQALNKLSASIDEMFDSVSFSESMK